LAEVLSGADMVFVTAGMGGGTGTGAAPVIAQVARDMGALTVGVVTKPFAFEGLQRKKKANSGIEALAKAVDALIIIPNDRLVALAGMKMTMRESFSMVDNVCLNAVRGISDLVMVPGLINVDFADVRTIMTGMGRALMGSGRGTGDKRAIEAAEMAINSPLLEDVSINGATGILVNITGGADLTLAEVNEACSLIQEASDPDANIIFGSVIDPNCGDEVRITVIATGFHSRVSTEIHPQAGLRQGAQSGARRSSDLHQMALPMQHPHAHYAQPVASAHAPSSGITPYPPPPLGSPFPLAADGEHDMGDGYPTVASFVHAPGAHGYPPNPTMGMQAGGYSASGEWAQVNDRPSGPNIRPQAPSPLSAAQAAASRRNGSAMAAPPPPMPSDELGIEESQYDTPAYLRRSRTPAGHDYAAMSYRMPDK
jgi:cell division protein FtsZ